MTEFKDFDATALIALPKPYKGAEESHGLLIHNRPDLFTLLREQEGVDVHVSRGIDSIDASTGKVSDVVRPAYGVSDTPVTLERFGEQQLSAYNVARSYGPTIDIDHYIESLNPMNVRNLARHKHEVASTVLAPLGLYRENILVTPDEAGALSEADIALSHSLIMKPNGGFASRDIVGGTPAEIRAHLLEGITEDKLIEERLNFGLPIPSIRGRDAYEQARLDEANEKIVNKELRLYSYGENVWYPVARIAEADSLRLTGDEWVYIDEDSVPIAALVAANLVKQAIDEKTGKTDTLLAVDLVYVTSESRPEPHWEVMEVNAEAYIMRPENNQSVGVQHQQLLADQLGRIARNSKH